MNHNMQNSAFDKAFKLKRNKIEKMN
jgi:hypothetical protein